MNKKKLLIISSIAVFLLIILYFSLRSKSGEELITCKVLKGSIEVKVHTSGQLESENSENIVLPSVLSTQNVRVYEIKITDLIEEGSVVDSGQYIATLDHKVIEEVLTQARLDLEAAMVVIEDARLDSNLNLSNYRDLITNSQSDVEERKIVLAESVYESPSVIKKAEMDLSKAERKLEQDIKGLAMRQRQLNSQMERRNIDFRLKQKRVDDLLKLYDALIIKAPKPGMVIYARDRFGIKIQVGSVLTPWSPIIATLPDMTKMISETFINEIDIAKIKVGQKVTLSIDAFPDKVLNGEVISVANIGQPMPKSDSKVFLVNIRVFGSDPDLKPAMTTGNLIQTGVYPDKLYVPSEAVFETDSTKFVYLHKKNIVRQLVDTGEENEDYVIINKGVVEGDELLLSEPEKTEDIETIGWDIYEEQLSRQKDKKISGEQASGVDTVRQGNNIVNK
ncbi:MAG: HlyD family efflux transporter periplasmic adaptor subunit [Prolixibacteraceae bacterium]|jgi:multidrug efflux pump subunit AcrA (membrane-fusion protein)|nr:HlyD family efflux transporter periplasmic adaptor subunit [Prolixibacteraceae bacterium]